MNALFRKRRIARWARTGLAVVALASGMVMYGLRADAQRGSAQQPASAPSRPVLRLDREQSISTVLDKGVTYHDLERLVTRARTVFDEGVSVAERNENGDILVTLSDRAGRAVARMNYLRGTVVPDSIELDIPGGRYLRTPATRGLKPTVEWANRQLITFWKDRNASGIGVNAWRQNVLRPVAAPVRDLDASVTEVEMHWSDGTIARTTQGSRVATPRNPGGSRRMGAVLSRGAERLGWAQYFYEDRVLTFSFGGSNSGHIDDAALKEYGGWGFVPDMAWLAMQAYAFYELPRRAQTQQQARIEAPGPISRALTAAWESFAPRLQAQDGCTGLNWLDYSIFRPCCDQHDLCFNKYGCDRYSWRWPFGYAWQCTGCNVEAVFCFVSGSRGGGPFYPTW